VEAAGTVRGTQSFIHTLTRCWKQPSLTALEIAWRWVFGIPALIFVYFQAHQVIFAATGGTMRAATLGLDDALLQDPVGALTARPMQAAAKFAVASGILLPGLLHVAVWLAPLLLVAWVVVSALGRDRVLRRVDPAMHTRVGTLMVLQLARMVALSAICVVWFVSIRWSAHFAVTGPIASGEDPNLVLYCALLIVLTLGLFVLWAIVSWLLSIAPMLAMLQDLGAAASIRAARRLGPLKSKLVEINLVMGIVKIALLVLLMVFSASPLPFEQQTSSTFLVWWWVGVTVVYLLWSDFFQVVRLVGYLDLWRAYNSKRASA
jgi:hypothetical protein